MKIFSLKTRFQNASVDVSSTSTNPQPEEMDLLLAEQKSILGNGVAVSALPVQFQNRLLSGERISNLELMRELKVVLS